MTEIQLDPEDAKLVTLARAARARNSAAEGAAVRDTTGRTYVATSVALPALVLSALQAAVAMAVSSGADGLEAAAIVTGAAAPGVGLDAGPDAGSNSGWRDPGLAAVADLGGQRTPVVVAGPDGVPRHQIEAGTAVP